MTQHSDLIDNAGLAMSSDDKSLIEFAQQRQAMLHDREKQLKTEIEGLTVRLGEVQRELRTVATVLASYAKPEQFPIEDGIRPPMTIKQGVLEVLKVVAPKGLSAIDILRRLASDFDMQYERTSLSPQLSRLKREGKIELKGNLWSLS